MKLQNSQFAAYRNSHAAGIPDKPARNGFTLIELLVVIAIISLLVSILVPSLKKAKDLARLTVCTSNEKQLGLCTQYYINDYQEYYPPYTSKGSVVYLFQPYLPRPDTSYSESVYFSYSPVWTCPTLQEYSYGKCPLYAANFTFCRGGFFQDTVKNLKVSDILNTADLLWMTDGVYYGSDHTYKEKWYDFIIFSDDRWQQFCFPNKTLANVFGYDNLASFRHDMKASFLFADFHVEVLSDQVADDLGYWEMDH